MRPDPVELGVDELVRQRNDARSELAKIGAKCSELIIKLEQAQQNSAMDCGHARRFRKLKGLCGSHTAVMDEKKECENCEWGCSECERIKAMEEQLKAADDLQLIGAMMSNICFNLAQPNTECDERARNSMNTCRIKWDKLQSAYIDLRGERNKEAKR